MDGLAETENYHAGKVSSIIVEYTLYSKMASRRDSHPKIRFMRPLTDKEKDFILSILKKEDNDG